MRQYLFGYRTLRARKAHFCDKCHNDIQPGELYERHILAVDSSFHVMREHIDPVCPEDYGEVFAREMAAQDRAALGVPMVLVGEVIQTQLVAVSGDIVTQNETRFVLKEASAVVADSKSSDPEEDVPF